MEQKTPFRLDTKLTGYYPLPRELLNMELPSTALVLYAVLLDRMTLSRKNGYADEKGCVYVIYPIEKLAVQYAVSNSRIASTLFSSANPDNVRRNIEWANEEPDWDLVREVKEIIGNQQRVTWANS